MPSRGDDRGDSVAGAAAAVEEAKTVTKENFEKAILKLLRLAIEGYPKALRSTPARRNEMLRKHSGNQDSCIGEVKESASKMSEEGKTWLLGLVPYVGLPAAVLYPSWMMLRRVCLMASLFGLDLGESKSQAKILHAFAGLRGVPAAECAVEMAVQAVWNAFAGPVAGVIPVGTLVTKVANVEGQVVDFVGKDTFAVERRPIPPEEYNQELDPEPTMRDYADLAMEGTAASLATAWYGAREGMDIALDGQRREQALNSAVEGGKTAAQTGATVAVGAAGLAVDVGKVGVFKGVELGGKGLNMAAGALGAGAGAGAKAEPAAAKPAPVVNLRG